MSSVVDATADLLETIADGRDQAEETGALSSEVVAACREAGLFGLGAPVEVGGHEATPVETFEAIQLVASVDPSVAWYMVNSLPVSRAAAWIDPDHWAAIYKPPLGNYGLSAAPTGRLLEDGDSFRLTGEWPLMTGVLDADWALVFAILDRDGSDPAVRQVLVPTSDLMVTEIWQDAAAMRGTGSHRVSATNATVPRGLIVDPSSPPRLQRPLYLGGSYVSHGFANSAVPIGILRSAVEATGNELRGKVSSIFGQKAVQSTALLELLSEAALALDHLYLGVRTALDLIWEYMLRGDTAPPQLRATVIGSPFRAVDVPET
jgi:alkylation response protein AidB-like acyl-CoA dehydrogenase